jgi:hypothetical protein
MIAILQGIWGNVSNMKEGIGNPEKQIDRALEGFGQLQSLIEGMPEGKWDPDE